MVGCEQLRQAAHELDYLEATLHLAKRVGPDLAVLADDKGGEVLATCIDEVAERK